MDDPVPTAGRNGLGPGRFTLSLARLRELEPDLFGLRAAFYRLRFEGDGPKALKERLRSAIYEGDPQPALVVSIDPVIVAAYSDELDAVLLVRFESAIARAHEWTMGTR